MTKRRYFAWVVLCIFVIGGFELWTSLNARASSHPDILIGEVAWAGSSLSTADEWLELWNTSSTDISIAGWSLEGASEKPIIFGATTTIPGLSAFLISNYGQDEKKSVLATSSQLITASISLSNSALQLQLKNTHDEIVDSVGDGHAPIAGTSGAVKTAMVHITDWISATTSMNMKNEVPDIGTPGFCDACQNESAFIPMHSDEIATNSESSTTVLIEPNPLIPTIPTLPSNPIQNTEHIVNNPPKPNYHFLRLNEIAPAPKKGNEWIEIVSVDSEKSIPLSGCTIHDSRGKIVTLKSGKISPGQHIILTFTRSVLRNIGESVSLFAPDGTLIDTSTYPAIDTEKSWIRFPDIIGDWQITTSSTPGEINTVTVNPLHKDTELKTDQNTIETIDVSSSANEYIEKAIPQSTKNSTQIQVNPHNTKNTKIKNTPTIPIHSISISMIPSLDASDPIRVRLHGRVGTLPHFIKNKTFILQAPDGHGLLVQASTNRKLPKFGNDIIVTGQLIANDDGAILKMLSTDAWTLDPTPRIPSSTPRNIDLLAPASEDIWSLIQTTGTVQDIKNKKIQIDIDGINAEITISRKLPYRTQRLKKGDIILVTGILAPGIEMPKIYPRNADDIEIVLHAPSPITVNSNSQIQTNQWMPMGATVCAIGAVEGAKRLHKKRKQKKLEKKISS